MKELFIRIGITKIGGDAMHTKTMEGLIGAREESREQISRLEHADTVELSEEGKAFVRENQDSGIDDASLPATNPAVAKEPVLYTSAGTAKPAESKPTVSVSV